MRRRKKQVYFSNRSKNKGLKRAWRKEKIRGRKAGYRKFVLMLLRKSRLNKTVFSPPLYRQDRYYYQFDKKPEYGETIKFLLDKIDKFSPEALPKIDNGILTLPVNFSLADNYAESMYFLKRLFYLLHYRRVPVIYVDYGRCKNLGLDASICMDLILYCFIKHYERCIKRGHLIKVQGIYPLNSSKLDPKLQRVLYSIGTPKNIRRLKYEFEDIIAFDLRTGDNKTGNRAGIKEVHETEIVDYVIQSLERMNRTLTPEAETNLSKVVGEIIANAEEHSHFRYRFAIGYFQESKDDNTHAGTFNLVIFNFGRTIYESFKALDCENVEVVKQMQKLSEEYTRKGFLRSAEFQEETLWTLYALQEGVTSVKGKRRGNGSIRFIDSFFKLNGDELGDKKSKLVLLSGNTKIVFDGTYELKEVVKGSQNKTYKMMTFNNSGNISEKPDKKYVNFVPQFFPGTLISAEICLTYNNIESISDGSRKETYY